MTPTSLIIRYRVMSRFSLTQKSILFVLLLFTSFTAFCMPIPDRHFFFLPVLTGLLFFIIMGIHFMRRVLINYEYLLYSDRLVIQLVLFRYRKTRLTLKLSSIQVICLSSQLSPSNAKIRLLDYTISPSARRVGYGFLFSAENGKNAFVILEASPDFAFLLSREVTNNK